MSQVKFKPVFVLPAELQTGVGLGDYIILVEIEVDAIDDITAETVLSQQMSQIQMLHWSKKEPGDD